MGLNLQDIGGYSIRVADLDAAKRFYVETLGFEVRYDVVWIYDMRYVALSPPGASTFLHLVQGEDASPEERGLLLVTRDVHADYAELTRRGVVFDAEVGPTGVPPLGDAAAFSDPDGNRWTLIEPWSAEEVQARAEGA